MDRRSVPDLARELLEGDKTSFARHLGEGGGFAPASDIEIHLQAFIDRAANADDRAERIKNRLDEASKLAVEYPAWMDSLGSDRRPGERRY